ncbi:hypothetical protein [Prosthecobacter vanneervenii]|uniref:Uncharacterized protein n=1 Tax=Prosthecobacter vanneervenii TaxID=48466 RepID=A0A7W8DKL9_9BACT|nr:hypothetical protein [Prosthecobacter vanneervenii]MBB5033170.1 hypothetical protein [Prosthecobacter vanneervenii]
MSGLLNIEIKADDSTPVLQELLKELSDLKPLNDYIGAAAAEGTRMHIRSAAEQRHTTAEQLGASPTGYLTKRAELVSYTASASGVELAVTGAIFRRVFGPVVIKPVAAKMLTIPWRAEAYGKRAREFDNLFVYVSRRGNGMAFLARREGKKIQLYYLLKSIVVLSQDTGLLPTVAQYAQAAEFGARGYLRKITAAAA